MPPRGSEGYDFTPILTHYLFLFTSILALVGWFVAFVSQAVVTAQIGHGGVGSLWFAIFLQLFLVLGVLHTLATDSIAMHRLQISVFGAVAIVFAVEGVNQSIFVQGVPAISAMAAGWLINAIVDILWVLYFTSEEDSLMLYVFNSMGTGGLTPPGRRRRRTQSLHNMGGNGYTAGYSAPSGNMGAVAGYDPKPNNFTGGPIGSGGGSFKAESVHARSNAGSINAPGSAAGAGSVAGADVGLSSPLMGSGNAGVGAGGGPGQLAGSPAAGSAPLDPPISGTSATSGDNFTYRAKALYGYTANPEDPNEISFTKGEILDILDKQGKWWQAKKADGTVGIAPSNYLQML